MNAHETLVLDYLGQFISQRRRDFVDRVLANRTRHLTVVLEDVFQSQNASAVIRTCECMGLQDIYFIEQRTRYQINPGVLRGANKWVDFHHYSSPTVNNTAACFDHLRKEGYRIAVTDPDPCGTSIHALAVEESKLALVFGNELHGVSAYAMEHADVKIHIPMYGFTESLNLSVSVAICLNALMEKLHRSAVTYQLSQQELIRLKLEWYRKIVRRSDLIEQEFLRTIE